MSSPFHGNPADPFNGKPVPALDSHRHVEPAQAAWLHSDTFISSAAPQPAKTPTSPPTPSEPAQASAYGELPEPATGQRGESEAVEIFEALLQKERDWWRDVEKITGISDVMRGTSAPVPVLGTVPAGEGPEPCAPVPWHKQEPGEVIVIDDTNGYLARAMSQPLDFTVTAYRMREGE